MPYFAFISTLTNPYIIPVVRILSLIATAMLFVCSFDFFVQSIYRQFFFMGLYDTTCIMHKRTEFLYKSYILKPPNYLERKLLRSIIFLRFVTSSRTTGKKFVTYN